MSSAVGKSVYLSPGDCSLVNSVGMSTDAVAAAVRAGISSIAESNVLNRQLSPMKLSLLPDHVLPVLPARSTPMTARQRRMLQLAACAVNNLLENRSLPQLPVMIAGPESPSVQEAENIIDRQFIEVLDGLVNSAFDCKRVAVVPRGRAAGLVALQDAIIHMQEAGVQQLLLLGIDSYLDFRLLASLDLDDRVMADGVMDGFFPGEGAAALLLTLKPKKDSIQIHLPGVADEQGHRFSEEPYRGDGLAEAMRTAIGNSKLQGITSTWCSMNGENIGAKEWGVGFTRNHGKFAEESAIHHPAEFFGDAGAACAPTLLALACNYIGKGFDTGPSLVWCSSERAERAAVVVSKIE